MMSCPRNLLLCKGDLDGSNHQISCRSERGPIMYEFVCKVLENHQGPHFQKDVPHSLITDIRYERKGTRKFFFFFSLFGGGGVLDRIMGIAMLK